MDSDKAGFSSIDEYIATFPEPVQAVLQTLRETIQAAAPDAEEKIAYQMPAFALNGILVYFAAWKNHIGFYPPISETAEFKPELTVYEGPKGAIRFPLDEPMPVDLITKIVKFRVAENRKEAEDKLRKRQ